MIPCIPTRVLFPTVKHFLTASVITISVMTEVQAAAEIQMSMGLPKTKEIQLKRKKLHEQVMSLKLLRDRISVNINKPHVSMHPLNFNSMLPHI